MSNRYGNHEQRGRFGKKWELLPRMEEMGRNGNKKKNRIKWEEIETAPWKNPGDRKQRSKL